MISYYGRGDKTKLGSNEIRILKLHAGFKKDELQGNLIPCAWQSATPQGAYSDEEDPEKEPSQNDDVLLARSRSGTSLPHIGHRSLSTTTQNQGHEFRSSLDGSGWSDTARNSSAKPASETVHNGVRDTKATEGDEPDFEPVPKYKALSYTWGEGEMTTSIKIIEGGNVYKIKMKPNLVDALKQLRYEPTREDDEGEPRYLWIDAICIDQKNNQEKSMQIPKMSEIYMKATEVAVWLGKAENNSAVAMDLIETCENFEKFDQQFSANTINVDSWEAFQKLLRRPWFSRRWIVQELTRANKATIYCGEKSNSWEVFADAVALFRQHEDKIREAFGKSEKSDYDPDHMGDLDELGAIRLVNSSDHLFRRDESRRITEKLLSLEGLMSTLTAFEASEPKDCIYAILWLAHDATPVSRGHAEEIEKRVQENLDKTKRELDEKEQAARDIENGFRNNANLEAGATLAMSAKSESEAESVVVHTKESTSLPETPESSENMLKVQERNSPPELSKRNGTGGHLMPPSEERGRPSQRGSQIIRVRSPSGFDGLSKLGQKHLAFTKFWGRLISKRFYIDYEQPLFQVCADFLKFCVTRSRSLDIICRYWAPDPTPDDEPLPSWIQRLSVGASFAKSHTGVMERVNADPLVGRPGTMEKKHYRASGGVADWEVLSSHPKVLIIQGFIIDAVGSKLDTARAGVIPSDWVEAANWSHFNEPPSESFWRTLVGNRDGQGERAPPLWRRVCKDAFSRRPPGGDLNITRLINSLKTPRASKPFLERVRAVTYRRRLLTRQRKDDKQPQLAQLALGPYESKKGDIIAIIYGCSVPVLLRMHINGSPVKFDIWDRPKIDLAKDQVRYQFIGECYVHAMMDGEALKLPPEERRPEVDGFWLI